MATIQTNLTCELQNGSVAVQYLNGVLFSQDNQANQINVAVYDGGEPATISGTVTANIIRADGGTVTATGGSISGNVASIAMPSAAYAVPGVASIIVKLSTSGVVTTLAAVVANIYESSTATAIDPGTIIPSVTALVAQIDAAVATIPANYSNLWTTLAPAFSTSATYTPGRYVTNNGGLYMFTNPHTGNWSASDVVAANIGNDLSSLKSAFKSVTEIINYLPSTQKNTTVVGLSVVYNDAVVTISGTSTGAGGRLVAISDSFILLPGTYTMSCEGLDNTIGVFLEEGSTVITSISPTTPISTFEVTTQKTAYIGINFVNNLTYNKTVKIQLQEGEEATSFIKPSQKTAIDFLSREDITEIKRQQSEYNKNLFVLDDATSGMYIAFGSGNAYAIANSFVSDYMPVSGGATLFMQNYTAQPSADARGLAFYDENKVFIVNSGVQYTNQNTMEIPIPEDAFYVRITVASSMVNETIVNVLLNYDAIKRIAEIQDRNILYAFSNITCFGDSLTYSQVYTSNNTSRQAYVPYPKVLEKMLSTPVEFYASAGITTAESWSAYKNNVVEKNNQLIIIYLGTNQGLTDTLATDAVGTDYNTYANTNTGCYAAYVAKAKAENAKVILIKVTGTSGESGVSDAAVTNSVIDQVATRYSCAVIEPIALTDPKYHYYPDGTGLNSGHYNDFGYSAFACVLAKKIALLNDADFKAIIPT